MTTVDTTTSAATTFPEAVADEDIQAEGTESSATATTTAPTEAQASEAVDTASDSLKTALEQTKEAASKAAKAGTGTGLERVVEAVVGLVTSLMSLIASLISSKQDPAQSSSSSASGTPADSSASRSGSGSSSSSAPLASPVAAPAPSTTATTPQKAGLQALTDEKGVVTVRTPDGFQLKAEDRDHAWQIIGPEGRVTRIWGDPHVTESDGDRWDFKEQGTFVFGANKITVETTPTANGKTISRQLTLYNGNERVTIGGIDTNKPYIIGLAQDGKQHDDSLSDGNTYRRGLGKGGESWSAKIGGKTRVMSNG